MTLAGYLTATRRVLRDSSGTLYTTVDLTAFVNEARHLRDVHTRLVRKVVGFSTTIGQSTYALSAIEAGTFVRGDDDFTNAREVVSAYVIPQGVAGGQGLRYPLGRQPYSKVAYIASTSWPSYPSIYALLGHSTVVMAPPPAMVYPVEWDLVGIYPDLADPSDPEPMPDPYNDPVPYMAAAIAKANAQRFDEGQAFEAMYKSRMMALGIGIRAFAIPNPMADLGRR